MSTLKLKASQKQIDEFADFVWQFLRTNFIEVKSTRPPLFLFNSAKSKGSLSPRSPAEKKFVHHIQFGGGGVVLHRPPILGYVSHWSQVPEEVAHLYALRVQTKPIQEDGRKQMHDIGVLHEAFGAFVQSLILPKLLHKNIRSSDSLWDAFHAEGIRQGRKLAKLFWNQKILPRHIKKYLRFQWHTPESARKALLYLGSLTRQNS
jgi:hypothetical protein